jgi:hypothetical protein
MAILYVGVDLAKNVFAVHGLNEAGKPERVHPSIGLTARQPASSLPFFESPCTASRPAERLLQVDWRSRHIEFVAPELGRRKNDRHSCPDTYKIEDSLLVASCVRRSADQETCLDRLVLTQKTQLSSSNLCPRIP